MMTPEQRQRFLDGKLTEKDKADILAAGPFCPYAEWAAHVTNGADRVHCRLLGAGAHIRISPDGLACRACRHGPNYDGRQRDTMAILSDNVARGLGSTKATARMRLDRRIEGWNADVSLARTREFFVEAVEKAPAKSGLSEADALQLVLDKGWVRV